MVFGKINGTTPKNLEENLFELRLNLENFIQNESDFTPETGRYHLYVSLACPWAHRTLIYRSLKDLDDHISVSVVNPYMLENGWTFEENFPGTTADHLFSQEYLYQIYLKANPNYSGRDSACPMGQKKSNHCQ